MAIPLPVAGTPHCKTAYQTPQVIGESKRQAAKLKENETKNAELTLAVDRIILEMGLIRQERDEAPARVGRLENALRAVAGGKIKAEKILEYYDNAHAPPNGKTVIRREINRQKSGERKKRNPAGQKGRRKGCKNAAVSRKATKTIRHRPGECGERGSANLEAVRTDDKIALDIPDMPQMEAVNRQTDTCRRLECGGITAPETGPVRGTYLGPNPLKTVVGLWKMNGSCQGIACPFSGLFGTNGCAKSAVQHARDGVAAHLEGGSAPCSAKLRGSGIAVFDAVGRACVDNGPEGLREGAPGQEERGGGVRPARPRGIRRETRSQKSRRRDGRGRSPGRARAPDG